ncbi:Hypothetical predicted protein [Cloeon dipterum]|uniref:Uncharacterized protein n=1 Tax=Cloeon dipterum TaxID=197152 RepID=A0A8S1DRM8_9INSE|nr:Hypothetical predicted protein [Cloeon dipterum]
MSDERGVNGESKIACGEESPRNGISETATTTNGAFSQKSVTQTDAGGRLRFFKDGKLIIELSHHEGERASWVPVPKKTYWPPRGKCSSLAPVTVAGSSRQECSTSLSVSDDNSSVQSSPWQRDHCWKQSHPRKDAGRFLVFLMRSDDSVKLVRWRNALALKRMRRRPFEIIVLKEDSVPGGKRPARETKRKELEAVVEILTAKAREAVKASPAPGCSKLDHCVVSPRKRILREFEKVLSPSPPSLNPHINAVRTMGSYTVPASTPSPSSSPSPSPATKCKERLGSYSINSLLGRPDDDPEPSSFLRSLLGTSPRSDRGSCGSSPSCVSSPQSPAEVRWRPSKKKVASPDPPQSLPIHQPFPGLNFFPPPPMAFFHPYNRSMWPHPSPAAHNINYPAAANFMPLGSVWSHPHLGPTAPLPGQQFCVDPRKREELTADMPLNLSKNAG